MGKWSTPTLGASGADAVTAVGGSCGMALGSTCVVGADATAETILGETGWVPMFAGEVAIFLKASAMVGTGGTILATFFFMRPLEVLGS